MNTLGVYKIHEHAIVPTFATEGSACFDVYASLANIKTINIHQNLGTNGITHSLN